MLWKYLQNKTIGIWGQGKEGLAVKKEILARQLSVKIKDITEENVKDIYDCDVLVKSPGVSLYREEIIRAQSQGIEITSSSNLFLANKDLKTKVIAITGTKGKSTTSALLYHTLQSLGQKVMLGGNIGKPLIELVNEKVDYVVAEMSSYQCADCKYGVNIGVLLNLYPEHLQWHNSHERYYNDKLNMIALAEKKIFNDKDINTKIFADKFKAEKFNNNQGCHIKDGYFYDGEKRLFATDVLNLKGEHNAENACAVLQVIKILGFLPEECEQAFSSFQGLAHRLQVVENKENIVWVDDSISTTPETAIAALRAFDKGEEMVLIAGGFDRGQDYNELIKFLKEKKNRIKPVLMPDTGRKIADEAKLQNVEFTFVDNMQTAVKEAKNILQKGGIVILSPAAPSYNLYKNFEARGEDFINCIKMLAKDKKMN